MCQMCILEYSKLNLKIARGIMPSPQTTLLYMVLDPLITGPT